MEFITDPDVLNQLKNGAAPQGAPSQQPGVDNDAWFHKTEDASILDTIGSKWSAANEAFWSTQASESDSNYAQKRLRQKADAANKEMEKLGTGGQFAVGAANVIPTVGAGMVNPLLGGAVASGLYSVDTLAQQVMEGQAPDIGSAVLSGLATGAVDMASGGIAGRIKGAVLPGIAKPTAQLGAKVGINAVEDAASSVAGNAFTNLATGKNWDENLTDAALLGAGGGAALRGSMSGLNKARQTPVNEWGKGAIEAVNKFREDGFTPSQAYADEVFGYDNQKADMTQRMGESTSTEQLGENADAIVNMALKGGGPNGSHIAMKIAKEDGIEFTDNAFNINAQRGLSRDSETYNLGHQLGRTDKQMQNAAVVGNEATNTRYFSRKARSEGWTSDSDKAQFQESAKKTLGKMQGSYNNNVSTVRNHLDVLNKSPDASPRDVQMTKELMSDLSTLRDAMYSYTGNKKTDVTDTVEIASKRAIRNATELGIANKLSGVDGKAGSWDPVVGIMAIDTFESMARARMPTFHQGAPDPNKLPSGKAGLMADIGLGMVGGGSLIVPRRLAAFGLDKLSQGKLKKSKTKAKSRLESLDEVMEKSATPGPRPDAPRPTRGRTSEPVVDEPIRSDVEPEAVVDAPVKPETPSEPAFDPTAPKAGAKATAITPDDIVGRKKPAVQPIKDRMPDYNKNLSLFDAEEAVGRKFIGNKGDSEARAEFLKDNGGVGAFKEKLKSGDFKDENINAFIAAKYKEKVDADTQAAGEKAKKEAETAAAKEGEEKARRTVETQEESLKWKAENAGVTKEQLDAAKASVLKDGEVLDTVAKVNRVITKAKAAKKVADGAAKREADTQAAVEKSVMKKVEPSYQRSEVGRVKSAIKSLGTQHTKTLFNDISDVLGAPDKSLKISDLEKIHSMIQDKVNPVLKGLRRDGSDDAKAQIEELEKGMKRAEDILERMEVDFTAAQNVTKGQQSRGDTKPKAEPKTVVDEKSYDEAVKVGSEADLEAPEISKLVEENTKGEKVDLEGFKKDVEKILEDKIEEMAKKFEKKFEDMEPARLLSTAEELIDTSVGTKDMKPTDKAQLEALKTVSERVDLKSYRLIKTYSDAVKKAMERKAEFPGEKNRKLWLSGDVLAEIQKIYNDGALGKREMGSIGKSLRRQVFGDSEYKASLSETEITSRMAALRRGKGIGGGEASNKMRKRLQDVKRK